jgi:hypothetical protein
VTSHVVSSNFEASNHCTSNCPLCQRCWLLSTSHGKHKAARTSVDLKRGATPRFYLLHSKNSCVSKEHSVTKYSTLLHMQTCIYLRYASGTLTETVWAMQGTPVLSMDLLHRSIKYFFRTVVFQLHPRKLVS